jgi:NAD(P)-dependent dehydrogenase (short-subunit alcohol dehydrogenase family)
MHVKASVLLTRRFAEALCLTRSEGLVVNIIDQRVLEADAALFLLHAVEGGAVGRPRSTMAQALAPRIRVNAIGPGPTLAQYVRQQTDADFRGAARRLMLGAGRNWVEFGATIRYLWQARSVTGQMIAIDGGQHLAWQTPDVTGMNE